jgi:hypothetical protein
MLLNFFNPKYDRSRTGKFHINIVQYIISLPGIRREVHYFLRGTAAFKFCGRLCKKSTPLFHIIDALVHIIHLIIRIDTANTICANILSKTRYGIPIYLNTRCYN